MLIVFGVALLVLAGAIVVLFAMLGELSNRMRAEPAARRDPSIRPLPEARLGVTPARWPHELRPDASDDHMVLIVLSSSCGTCIDIAAQLSHDPGHADWDEMRVVISTMGRGIGENFVAQHGLSSFPVFIDEGGDWVTGELGIRMSPCALVFRDGQLTAAYMFYDVVALRAKIRHEHETQHEHEHEHDNVSPKQEEFT
jgi:hypothetical protein